MKTKHFPVTDLVCPHCHGKGKINWIDPASLRRARRQAGESLRSLAGRAGLSAAYLSDVENGRRNLTERVHDLYLSLL